MLTFQTFSHHLPSGDREQSIVGRPEGVGGAHGRSALQDAITHYYYQYYNIFIFITCILQSCFLHLTGEFHCHCGTPSMGFAHRLFYVRVLVQVGKTRLDFAEVIGTFVRLVRLLSRLEDSWRQRGRTHIITSIYTKQVCVCVVSDRTSPPSLSSYCSNNYQSALKITQFSVCDLRCRSGRPHRIQAIL